MLVCEDEVSLHKLSFLAFYIFRFLGTIAWYFRLFHVLRETGLTSYRIYILS
jgi:hypothetical protein